jgi:poly-gamma-glutamate synthesis protein (capsule biosynthesis protein)
MTGRGIDQILPHPSNPRLYEPYVKSAVRYVDIAEKVNGPISKPVDFAYIWGDALQELERAQPDVRIINLETAVTVSDDYWKGKGINYRMHPDNIACIQTAEIDCCVLANNHVLDWGYRGLEETLSTLDRVNIKSAGAGRNAAAAATPAVIDVKGKSRVLVFALGSETSGIPRAWAASENKAGVHLLKDFSDNTVRNIAASIQQVKRTHDIVVASIHWGRNWGYHIPREQTRFAHQLIDDAAVDVIHGHSSHHPKGIEVYKQRPIIYGCGDFINDYEGIGGYAEFKSELGLMYFVTMNADNGELVDFHMTPTRIKRFTVRRAIGADAQWLSDVLNREGGRLGTGTQLGVDNTLTLTWKS